MSVEANGGNGPVVETTTTEVIPQSVALKDEDLVEYEVGGQKVQKPWKEARGGFMRQEDYTRKTQEVAKQAKELKDLYEQIRSRETSIAEKELAIDKILGRAKPDEKKTSVDDDEVITGKQARELLDQQRRELEAALETKLGEQSAKSQQERLFQRFEDLTQETVTQLVKEYPVLKRIPQLDLVLKREALRDKPQDEAEMKRAYAAVGKRLAEGLDEEFTARKKAEATRKQELTSKGSLPPGGGPQLAPPKKSYGERGKINWDELESDALAAVEALEE